MKNNMGRRSRGQKLKRLRMSVRSWAPLFWVQMLRALIAGMLLWGCRGLALAQTTTVVDVLSTGASQFDGGAILPVGSTLTISGSANTWIMVSSSDFGTVQTDTITLTNYLQSYEANSSSITWRIDFNIIVSSNAHYGLVFGSGGAADFATHYGENSVVASYGGGVGASGGAINSAHYFLLDCDYSGNNYMPNAGSTMSGSITFESVEGSSTTWVIAADRRYNSPNGVVLPNIVGFYNGGLIPTTITMIGTATDNPSLPTINAPFRGHIEVWRKGFQRK